MITAGLKRRQVPRPLPVIKPALQEQTVETRWAGA